MLLAKEMFKREREILLSFLNFDILQDVTWLQLLFCSVDAFSDGDALMDDIFHIESMLISLQCPLF